MSKMDGLRAMREARYAKAATPATRPATRHTGGLTAPAPIPAQAPVDTEERCGHRAIGGRTCTREQGHAARSHRYS